jgi:hypothetical protein
MRKEGFKLWLLIFNFLFAATFDFQNGFIYDDNIYQFSQKDLQAFQRGKKEQDYKTTDDLIGEIILKLNFYQEHFKFSFASQYKNYFQNRKKSYQEYKLTIFFSKVDFGYSFLPNYYLRNFYQKPCLYTEHTFFSQIKFNNLGIGLKNEIDIYNKDFSYYNGNIFSTLLKYEKDFDSKYQIKTALTFTKNFLINKLKENEPDIAYFQMGSRGQIKRRGDFFDLSGFIEIKRRAYLTKKDLSHKGRLDYLFAFGWEILLKLKKDLQLSFGYGYERRDCKIPYKEEYEDIKNYYKNIFYLKLAKGGKL